MTRIELWNGDICDLEVDAIVSPATTSLWMSTGTAGEIKRAGGDAIEFAAIRQAPAALGDAIVTPRRPARRQGRHPRRLPRAGSQDERVLPSTAPPAAPWRASASWVCRAWPSRPLAPGSAGSRWTRPPASP